MVKGGCGRGRPAGGWLGHARLRIIDLSAAAHQPMCPMNGASSLTYNGEIYNFRELRARARGARATGSARRGDTEVVLRAYEEWGDGFVERLDGMFALAIWDARDADGCCSRAIARQEAALLLARRRAARLRLGDQGVLVTAPWVDAPSSTRAARRVPDLRLRAAPAHALRRHRAGPARLRAGLRRRRRRATPRTYWDAAAGADARRARSTRAARATSATRLRAAVERRLGRRRPARRVALRAGSTPRSSSASWHGRDGRCTRSASGSPTTPRSTSASYARAGRRPLRHRAHRVRGARRRGRR